MEEISASVFPIPKGLIGLEMFVEKGIKSYVVAIYYESVRGGVDIPSHTAANSMVGAPYPEVVANDIVAVYNHGCLNVYLSWSEASNAEEKVAQHNRVV